MADSQPGQQDEMHEQHGQVDAGGTLQDSPPAPELEALLWQAFGISGTLTTLPDAPGAFAVIDTEHSYRLDITGDTTLCETLVRQAGILEALEATGSQTLLQVPHPVRSRSERLLVPLSEQDGEAGPWVRVLALPDADRSSGPLPVSSATAARLGRFVAELTRQLAVIEEAGPASGEASATAPLASPLDLRQAGPLVVKLLRSVGDPQVRNPVAKCMVTALRQIQPLGADLRRQLVHHAPTRAELVIADGDGQGWEPIGFRTAGALGEGWIIAPLAALLADLMSGAGADPFAGLPALSAFHAALPLTEAELKALWPLTLIRIAFLRAEAEQQAVAAPEDAAGLEARETARRLFRAASDVHPAFMEVAILDAVGWPQEPVAALEPLLPQIDVGAIRLADLSVASPLFAEGNWEDPEIDWRLLARVAFDSRMGATRFGEYRLSRGGAPGEVEAENLALHVDLCVPAGTVVAAPMGGVLHLGDNRIVLAGKGVSLQLEGLDCPLNEATALFAGDPIGVVAGAEGAVGGLRIRLSRVSDLMPPLFAPHRLAPVWRRLALSPSLVLGRDVDAPEVAAAPLARGWRDTVFDSHGRAFIDLSGAAGLVGHGHPDMAEAAYRQWLTLAGVQGTGADADFRRALLSLLPDGLATIVALTDEDQAMVIALDLAERLASDPATPLSIADERRTGFGRLGSRLWGFETEEVLPDIVVTGSPVPGAPLAAVVLQARHAGDAADPDLDAADAVTCRIGCAVLASFEQPDINEATREVADFLEAAVRALCEAVPHLLSFEGGGLALELVLGPEAPSAFELARHLAQHGILAARPQTPDRLSLTAPLCLSRASADRLVTALGALFAAPRREPETSAET
ncbi:aminotransferase class III-fold pyridoxal phosphate-dependent enzyme [Rhizobium straminoryzae]|nr:aminotransferase class III-fold pyridoxal phosphate-dependent enzyme [Rhizobium straminoryzae]